MDAPSRCAEDGDHPLATVSQLVRRAEPQVLLVTEGTYPFVLGGVSSWCQMMVERLSDVRWLVLPIVAGNTERGSLYPLPSNVAVADPIELWSLHPPAQARSSRRSAASSGSDLPRALLRGLFAWDGAVDELVAALRWCRDEPGGIRYIFRSRRAWELYHEALGELLADDLATLEDPLDHFDAAALYQTLYWVARTAATPTPQVDLVHSTAAGWGAIPAAVHRELTGTPVLLTEHGLYMREAYLSAIIDGLSAGELFVRTRLARGLTRLAYATSDHFAPVSDFNRRWELGNGVEPDRIEVVANGVRADQIPTPLPGDRIVVSVGRIDPLKDVMTLLRVAHEVIERRPDVRFVHHGPVSPGQEAYGRACLLLHERLGLGERFRFAGPTREPHAAVRAGDVSLLTSISEGMPLAVLEAMAQARPVVATAVGGVPEVVRGCGLMAPPGQVAKLATAVCTLLDDPELAQALALRGRARVARRFAQEQHVAAYQRIVGDLTARVPGSAVA